MKKTVRITDITKMRSSICIAGYLSKDGTCVRPVSRYALTNHFLDAGEYEIEPFDLVELKFLPDKPRITPPHTEDCLIDSSYRVVQSTLSTGARQAFLVKILDDSVENIFGAKIRRRPGWYVNEGEGERSLGTILVNELLGFAANEPRLTFVDAAEEEYSLKITDLMHRRYTDALHAEGLSYLEINEHLLDKLANAKVFLRIGLARGNWDKYPGKCFLQINAIHSFPDYRED